ncbi:MAG: hypothetical protein GC155_01570 [Alphaproteobacteria bacterium]|nr:hypothetical protein [Alphaproteobacteria bacterium]
MRDGPPIALLVIGIIAGAAAGLALHNTLLGVVVALGLGAAYTAFQMILHPRAPAPKADAPAKED